MTPVKVIYKNGEFFCRCDFASRLLPRDAGFRFDPVLKIWRTSSLKVAVRLRDFADKTAQEKIDKQFIRISPWSGPLPYPRDLIPYDFQLEAARFALARNRAYLGLDAGLGKTIVTAIVINALKIPVVWICPPFLTRNVEAELKRWLTYPADVLRLEGKTAGLGGAEILVVPDSILNRREVFDDIQHTLRGREALLVVDEAHRFKTPDAIRTQMLFGDKNGEGGISEIFARAIYLSGTPMPNRPMELFSVLSSQAPETIDFRNYFKYGLEYCAAYRDEYGAWDFSGASNLAKLRSQVYGKFMLRMKKADVLKSLPPKTEEIVIIGEAPARLIAMEQAILAKNSPEDLVAGTVSSDHIATYRRELGELKVKPSVEFIRALLSETKESLLVFAFHKKVIADLAEALKEFAPLVIVGSTPNEERNEIVNTFQTSKTRRLFIGNYQAAGVGLTLTKATRVIFVEMSWTPAENEQASDRAHRIGQRDNVFVQYLVYENSMDKKIMDVCFRKKRVTAYI